METQPDNKKAAEEPSSSSDSTTRRRIRLLLHAVDGLVPYLTPQLLHSCFPAETMGDRLWIGIAVKDTCVVPTFATTNDDAEKNHHPRGYQFSASVAIDAWMRPYTRVTVPTFDMAKDVQERQHAKDAAVVATDQHIMLWTGNGRQPITPEQYFASAQGLDSAWNVPLFDAGGTTASLKQKRWTVAQKRTLEWSRDYQKRSTTPTKSGTLFPILVSTTAGSFGIGDQLQLLLKDNKDLGVSDKIGLVLIGWSDVPKTLQLSSLEQVKKHLPEARLGILATNSLAQVLLAACHGTTIIGSNLPQQWALQKKVFLFDMKEACSVINATEPPPKRLKTNETLTVQPDQDSCLDLHPPGDRVEDHPWYREKRPIIPNCTCHTCQTHSRAYLYHLVCAKEMLAEVLLFIHNLHHLLHILRSIESDKDEAVKRSSLLTYISSIFKQSSIPSDES